MLLRPKQNLIYSTIPRWAFLYPHISPALPFLPSAPLRRQRRLLTQQCLRLRYREATRVASGILINL